VDGEFTLRRNREAYDWVTLIPRAVADVSTVDLSTELLGQKLHAPILVAPTAGHLQFHPQGELETHRGATAANTTMIVSTSASQPIDKIAAAAEGPLWFQLYVRDTPEATRELVEAAQSAGCRAICVTVDTQYHSHRERILHNRHLTPAAPARTSARRRGPERPPAPYGLRPQTPWLDWKFLDAIRAYTKIPILLKGVITPEDARLAVERGADGIVVSNHGGRYLDYDPSTIEVLPEIADAVGGRIPVLMDGGVRRGSDILKALALGAKAVLVGRAPLWGLGAFGAAGVRRVLEILQGELALAMAHTGRPNIASIDRSLAATDFP
jgi:isopentenyl diphosphate isomerase/L-lactate dehydrogenase-like FMN-dependent dehydrogenase